MSYSSQSIFSALEIEEFHLHHPQVSGLLIMVILVLLFRDKKDLKASAYPIRELNGGLACTFNE